jgi:hypothetical protein
MCITGVWHILEFGWRKGQRIGMSVLKGVTRISSPV